MLNTRPLLAACNTFLRGGDDWSACVNRYLRITCEFCIALPMVIIGVNRSQLPHSKAVLHLLVLWPNGCSAVPSISACQLGIRSLTHRFWACGSCGSD